MGTSSHTIHSHPHTPIIHEYYSRGIYYWSTYRRYQQPQSSSSKLCSSSILIPQKRGSVEFRLPKSSLSYSFLSRFYPQRNHHHHHHHVGRFERHETRSRERVLRKRARARNSRVHRQAEKRGKVRRGDETCESFCVLVYLGCLTASVGTLGARVR